MYGIIYFVLGALVAHCLACFFVPLAARWKRGSAGAFLWALGCSLISPLVLVAIQLGRISSPRPSSWIIRAVVGCVVAFGLVWLGDSTIVVSPSMLKFKGQLVSMACSEIVFQRGPVLSIRDASAELYQFCNSAFASSALMFGTAMLFFRNPYEKALIFGIVAFAVSLTSDSILLANWLVAMANGASDSQLGSLNGIRPYINFYAPVVIFFWTSVLWAWWDARKIATEGGAHEDRSL